MKKVKLVKELSNIVKEHTTEQDVCRINLDDVVLNFINSYNIKSTNDVKNDAMLNELVDFIKINNEASRVEIW